MTISSPYFLLSIVNTKNIEMKYALLENFKIKKSKAIYFGVVSKKNLLSAVCKYVRHKNKFHVFPLTLLTLIFCAYPTVFFAIFEQALLKSECVSFRN